MNLKQACNKIGAQLNIDGKQLYEYAISDDIGGYNSDPKASKWEIGSIWEVEGQILYGLVRILKPKMVINLGVHLGCSVTHIAQAMKDNEEGVLIAVDRVNWDIKKLDKSLRPYVTFVNQDAVDYVKNDMPSRRVDMIFEDLSHDTGEIATIWEDAIKKVKNDALLINHDSEHHIVGDAVRASWALVNMQGVQSYLVEPSDCGLSIWQNT